MLDRAVVTYQTGWWVVLLFVRFVCWFVTLRCHLLRCCCCDPVTATPFLHVRYLVGWIGSGFHVPTYIRSLLFCWCTHFTFVPLSFYCYTFSLPHFATDRLIPSPLRWFLTIYVYDHVVGCCYSPLVTFTTFACISFILHFTHIYILTVVVCSPFPFFSVYVCYTHTTHARSSFRSLNSLSSHATRFTHVVAFDSRCPFRIHCWRQMERMRFTSHFTAPHLLLYGGQEHVGVLILPAFTTFPYRFTLPLLLFYSHLIHYVYIHSFCYFLPLPVICARYICVTLPLCLHSHVVVVVLLLYVLHSSFYTFDLSFDFVHNLRFCLLHFYSSSCSLVIVFTYAFCCPYMPCDALSSFTPPIIFTFGPLLFIIYLFIPHLHWWVRWRNHSRYCCYYLLTLLLMLGMWVVIYIYYLYNHLPFPSSSFHCVCDPLPTPLWSRVGRVGMPLTLFDLGIYIYWLLLVLVPLPSPIPLPSSTFIYSLLLFVVVIIVFVGDVYSPNIHSIFLYTFVRWLRCHWYFIVHIIHSPPLCPTSPPHIVIDPIGGWWCGVGVVVVVLISGWVWCGRSFPLIYPTFIIITILLHVLHFVVVDRWVVLLVLLLCPHLSFPGIDPWFVVLLTPPLFVLFDSPLILPIRALLLLLIHCSVIWP